MDYIRTTVADLIAAFDTRDPFLLCESLDILLLRVELPPSMEGFCATIQGHPVIYLSDGLCWERQRQVCAHELGHALLHRGVNRFFVEGCTHLRPGRYEREADLFAAYLLIDGRLLQEEASRTVEELSHLAGVEPRLMELYAREALGLG